MVGAPAQGKAPFQFQCGHVTVVTQRGPFAHRLVYSIVKTDESTLCLDEEEIFHL